MKERIIGAAVLVLVVVLVVPVFLDGPPDADEIVSQSVPLPGQADQKTQTIVLDRDRDDPVPSAATKLPEAQTPKPDAPPPQAAERTAVPGDNATRSEAKDVVPERAAPNPVDEPIEETAEPSAASTVASTTGMWAVQVGSFGNQENAERLAADLRGQGFAAFLSKLTTNAGELHRVRVGPQADRASADQMAARLKKAGHDVKVLPHP